MQNNMWLNKEQREIAGEMAKFGDEELEKGMGDRDTIVTIDVKSKHFYDNLLFYNDNKKFYTGKKTSTFPKFKSKFLQKD